LFDAVGFDEFGEHVKMVGLYGRKVRD
jgi:hypothetical protein